MKLQVAKDFFGIAAWPMDEGIEYGNGFAQDHISAKPGWMRKKLTAPFCQSLYQVLTQKWFKKNMPDFGKDMKDGDLVVMELSFTKVETGSK